MADSPNQIEATLLLMIKRLEAENSDLKDQLRETVLNMETTLEELSARIRRAKEHLVASNSNPLELE